ncbi:MAG: hypothetical protein JW943_08245 [Deltaproteobacteria bacterium]|nr:hypothetical protein [Deltaproteobacteria bacterium]
MNKMISTVVFVIILIGILAGGYWFYTTRISHTAIGDILKNPRNYEGTSVTIEGQVIDPISLLIVKYYKVKDNTGEIIVTTRRLLPTAGEKIRVKGTIDSAFSIGPEQLLVLIETEKQQK